MSYVIALSAFFVIVIIFAVSLGGPSFPPTLSYSKIYSDNGVVLSDLHDSSVLIQSDSISVSGINHTETDVLTFEINPASSELGGVRSFICPSGSFVSGINSTGNLVCDVP